MKVVLGSDHAGFRLKEHLKDFVASLGHEVEDVGTKSTDSVDYPEFGAAVGRRVVELGGDARGIAVCGSGLGIAMAANKIPGVRAAAVSEPTAARLTRLHNDANVLALGERLMGVAVAESCVRTFLETPFEGGRHERRVEQLNELEKNGLEKK
jgi:ribose 5-phosphate isomerase B